MTDVRKIRQHHGMSQSEFAAALGVQQQTVNRWETQKNVGSTFGLRMALWRITQGDEPRLTAWKALYRDGD